MADKVQERDPDIWIFNTSILQIWLRKVIQYCPTDKMIGDYYTKPTHGEKEVRLFKQAILNLPKTNTCQLMIMAFTSYDK
jgi:hypothetical protein